MISADPATADGWRITTDDKVIQKIPADEFRFLLHWGANIYHDYAELKVALDHTDDINHERVFDIFIKDLRARGETFDIPSDPIADPAFVNRLTSIYDPGKPTFYPPEPVEDAVAA